MFAGEIGARNTRETREKVVKIGSVRDGKDREKDAFGIP